MNIDPTDRLVLHIDHTDTGGVLYRLMDETTGLDLLYGELAAPMVAWAAGNALVVMRTREQRLADLERLERRRRPRTGQ